ncbi:MAG TPA: ATPase, T2SS/T4P/T4SS family, partial [Bdellovibrionales bacterium]|nr:ATPase, T2SS/T4P/T4SS family [Bdellovibrionales bacterium]
VSTLHTNDAASTVSRLVEIGVEPYIVAEATTLVVAQRLIRRNCPRCAVEHRVPDEILLKMGVKAPELPEFKRVKKGEGCEECSGSGLRGRLAIFEMMRMTPRIKEGVYKKASMFEIKRYAIEDGMRTLRQSALLKLKAGVTTVEEVLNTTVADDLT